MDKNLETSLLCNKNFQECLNSFQCKSLLKRYIHTCIHISSFCPCLYGFTINHIQEGTVLVHVQYLQQKSTEITILVHSYKLGQETLEMFQMFILMYSCIQHDFAVACPNKKSNNCSYAVIRRCKCSGISRNVKKQQLSLALRIVDISKQN